MNHCLLLLASDIDPGQSELWRTVEKIVQSGLATAFGTLIWAILIAILGVLGLHPRARALLSWIHARRWATVSAAAVLIMLLLLIFAVGLGALPAAGYVKLVALWPLETVSVTLPRVGVLVLFVLAILKLWDWRGRIFQRVGGILLHLRQFAQAVRPIRREEERDAQQTSSEAEPPTEAAIVGFLARLADEWDLTYGRGGVKEERCEIASDGRYFVIDPRRGIRGIRPTFTLRVTSLDEESGCLRWDKVGPQGDVFHAEELQFEPGGEILVLDGHRVGSPEHVIRYRRR